MLVTPALAQTEVVAQTTTVPDWLFILSLFGGILIVLVVLGVFALAWQGNKSARLNVPVDQFQPLITELVRTLNEQMVLARDKAALTPSPLDDIGLMLAGIPVDALKNHLEDQGFEIKPKDGATDPLD